MTRIDRDRAVAALLVSGAALLLLEIRFEHREVLGETWRSWIPLSWCALTVVLGAAALLRWTRWGRPALAACFALALLVGAAGFWFHTGGHLLTAARQVVAMWRVPPGQDGGIKMGSAPPALAPLAFCGLGALGLLVCGPRR